MLKLVRFEGILFAMKVNGCIALGATATHLNFDSSDHGEQFLLE